MEKLYSRKDVLAIIPLSATTIWRLEKAGKFPNRRQISPGKVGYLASEIDEWAASRQLVAGADLGGGR